MRFLVLWFLLLVLALGVMAMTYNLTTFRTLTNPGTPSTGCFDIANDVIYIVMQANSPRRYMVYSYDLAGNYLTHFTKPYGTTNDTLYSPTDMKIYAGEIYIADGNSRIQVFDLLGNFSRAWGAQSGQLFQQKFTIGTDGLVYMHCMVSVGDWWRERIQVFTTNGVYVREVSYFTPTAPYQTYFVQGISVLGNGNIVLTHATNAIAAGTPVAGWSLPTGETLYQRGQIRVDGDDNIYVTTRGPHYHYIYHSDGSLNERLDVGSRAPVAPYQIQRYGNAIYGVADAVVAHLLIWTISNQSTQLSAVVDNLFGLHHTAYTATGLRHVLAPIGGAREGAVLVDAAGAKPSLVLLTDGRLRVVYQDAAGAVQTRYSRDLGATWTVS
jgi:hypothetical protein